MWKIIGWAIWGIVALLSLWGVFNNRNKIKSGHNFNFATGMVIFFMWIIAVLFLVFDWNKIHILWLLTVMLFPIPFLVLEKIPLLSPFFIFTTEIFWSIALIGINIEPSEENENEEESDEENLNMEQDPLERYKRIREVGRSLTEKMMKHIPKFATMKAAKDLNLVGPKGFLVFDSESETSFLIDRCFHDIQWDGKNLIDHFLESEDYKKITEEEQAIVQGMATAYYSLFEIIDVNPSEGTLELYDLLDSKTYTITDINSSRTTSKRYILAGRIQQIEGMYMTTGTICPFLTEHKQNLLDGLEQKRVSGRRKPKKIQRSDYSAYFFKKYKRTEEIRFMTVDEME